MAPRHESKDLRGHTTKKLGAGTSSQGFSEHPVVSVVRTQRKQHKSWEYWGHAADGIRHYANANLGGMRGVNARRSTRLLAAPIGAEPTWPLRVLPFLDACSSGCSGRRP